MGTVRSKRSRASDAVMPDSANLSSISCEPCRQRKCKCDRKLPYCAQCSSEPSKCIYPESGKRGLPLGYLNQLEQRLSETEAALYSALATLRAIRPTTLVQASPNPGSMHKQKAARMDEWNQLPLRGWSDMERWLAGMSQQFSVEQTHTPSVPFMEPSDGSFEMQQSPSHPSHSSIHSPEENVDAGVPLTSYAWPQRRDIPMGSSYETRPRPPEMMSSPVLSRDQPSGGPDSVALPVGGVQEYTNVAMFSESGPGRPIERTSAAGAEELSKNKPSIYF